MREPNDKDDDDGRDVILEGTLITKKRKQRLTLPSQGEERRGETKSVDERNTVGDDTLQSQPFGTVLIRKHFGRVKRLKWCPTKREEHHEQVYLITSVF